MEELNVNVSEILDGYICEKPGGHYVCMIRFVLKPEEVKNYPRKSILNVKNDKELLFCGYIYRTVVPVLLFEEWECTIVAYSAGILMDKKLSTYTYQNKSLKEIIEGICQVYGGDCIIDDKVSNLPKGFYVQYSETDWSFLHRLSEQQGACICVDWKSENPKLFVGELKRMTWGRQHMAPIYFYNGSCYDKAVGDRGNKTLIRSGVTETLYEAAVASYNETAFDLPAGWIMVDSEGLSGTGFCAITLQRNKNIIVAFAGTDDIKDIVYDIAQEGGLAGGIGGGLTGGVPGAIAGSMIGSLLESGASQIPAKQARAYITRTMKRFTGYKIYITGHSLGGHMAIEAALYMLKLNQFECVGQVEVFNGFGPGSDLGTRENILKIKDKVFSREYRLDVVSEYRAMPKNKEVYDDGLFDIVKGTMKAKNFGYSTGNLLQSLAENAALKVYFSLGVNHSIDRFRQHFQNNIPLHSSGVNDTFRLVSATLKGKVLRVEKETLKVKFEQDRFSTSEQDAFLFHKATPYTGVYMMPEPGDIIYIEFKFLSNYNNSPFETVRCVKIERSSKTTE